MIPEIETLRAKHLPDVLADAAVNFIETGDPSIPRGIGNLQKVPWQAKSVGTALISDLPWNEISRKLLRFFVHLSNGSLSQADYVHGALGFLLGLKSGSDQGIADDVVSEIEALHQNLPEYVEDFIASHYGPANWKIASISNVTAPFESPAANLIYRGITPEHWTHAESLCRMPEIFSALAIHQPLITRDWCVKSPNFGAAYVSTSWRNIINATEAYDPLCLEYCKALSSYRANEAFPVLGHLHESRNGAHLELLLDLASQPHAVAGSAALELLMKHRRLMVVKLITRAFALENAGRFTLDADKAVYRQLFTLMTEEWNQGGSDFLINLVSNYNTYRFPQLLSDHLQDLKPECYPALRQGIRLRVASLSARDLADQWRAVATAHAASCVEDFKQLLVGKSKPLREIAASALVKAEGNSAMEEILQLLMSKKSDARLGAAAFLDKLADGTTVPMIRNALEVEQSTEVRAALHKALQACGASETPTRELVISLADLEGSYSKALSKLKLPTATWLVLENLPTLPAIVGTSLSNNAITFLISVQSKHKAIEAAPDLLPLLAHIDLNRSAPFAAFLVEGFLNSDQAASDRWALTLGGLLGDSHIIPPLLSRINDWCENSRHKLAEYAAQAISLLPGNEPLMVLDTLSNRYRSKFKNVGKACSEAFNAAATSRGITTDELGDLVVPDFGFDSDGIRRFDWDGGGASAELGADFKLTWFDPETDKTWKALPASAPEEIKTEVKSLTKLLREAVKGQNSRLEMTLVRQRRWPVARWRELFENHPLLRSFASSLVWGVYDSTGKLLRTFRRYPNGLLANAAGALEELTENDTVIGMVHPLELEKIALDAWRAHLARFKVKLPFPQIDRSVELLDPLHGNRREISVTKEKKLSAGTFRSRAEKRGWNRGSVVDAGGISSYYKLYPGAGVEVILPTGNFWIGCDPMETIELGAAFFVEAESVERGSYVYNEPAPDDPRVLRFDQVPAVVWSETISDLKAIVATKE